MKKTLKTVLITVMVAIMLICAVACGNNELNFGKELVKVEAMVNILTELTAKTADVGVMDSIMAGYYMSQDTNYSEKLMIIDNLILAEEEYGIAARKNGASTIYKINKALQALTNDKTVDTIASKYGLKSDVIINKDLALGEEPTDGDWENIVSSGELKIGYTLFAPIAYKDADGNLIGFDIELARAVAEYYGLTVKFVEIVWETKEIELTDKHIDLIWNGMTITDERKASMSISIPYLANKQVAVIRKEDKDVYTADTASMKKAVIAVEGGSAGQSVVEKTAQK